MVRSVGVASAAAALALGVAGTASACSITEFTSASISCDTQSGKGVVTVLDQDSSGTKVDISVQSGGQTLDTQPGIVGTKEGVKVTFPGIAWTNGATYTVHVVKSDSHDLVGDKTVTAEGDCAAPAPPSSPAVPPAPPAKPGKPVSPAKPASSPSTSPTAAAATSAAAAVADTSSPSPSSNLAETGGGSNTGMIAGVAAVLVALGGGAVFMLRRRSPATRH